MLASNPAARSGADLLFSDGLDFLDRGFKDQFSSLAERVESSLTIVGKLRYSSRFSGSYIHFLGGSSLNRIGTVMDKNS